MKTEPPTKVIFRTCRDKSAEVLAIFQELPDDVRGYQCMFYAHTGQHGGGDRHNLVRMTRPATEAAPLQKELEGIGYVLQPVCKISATMDRTRMDAARGES